LNLGTLGAIFKFSLEIENKALAFYEEYIELENFGDIVVQYRKRIKRLKRIQRENTTEMILEPIEDFKGLLFDFSSEGKEFKDVESVISFAKSMEEKIKIFYFQASEKVTFLKEVAYIFKEFSKEHDS